MPKCPASYKYSGNVAGCEYVLSLDSNSNKISAETKKCVEGALSATVEATYKGEAITLGSITATGKVDGYAVTVEQSLGKQSFALGFDVDALITQITHGADPSVAEAAMQKFMEQAADWIVTAAFEQLVGGALTGAGGVREAVENAQSEFCAAFSGEVLGHTGDYCDPSDCNMEVFPATKAITGGAVGASSGNIYESLCPVVNKAQRLQLGLLIGRDHVFVGAQAACPPKRRW